MQQNKGRHLEKKLSPSKEEYLKAIYKLSERNQSVRSIDIAVYLGVSKPSVHNAVTALQEEGLVVKPLGGEIQITEEGRKQGKAVTAKFQIIRQFLITCCNVNDMTASADACKMEHIISDDAVFALEKYLSAKEDDNT